MPKPATSYKASDQPALRPYLVIKDAPAAIDFYRRAFGATEVSRSTLPDGKTIAHAQIDIDGCAIYLTEENPQWGSRGPLTLGGTPVSLYLFVKDVDAVMQTAAAAGAKITQPASDMFWGDRWGQIKDPFGHDWQIATHKVDLTPEELAEGAKKMFAEMAASQKN